MATPYRRLVKPKSPPSSYGIAAFLDGEPGSAWRVVSLTGQRAFFIGTGLYVAGIRGKQLLRGAVYASSVVTLWIMGLFLLRDKE